MLPPGCLAILLLVALGILVPVLLADAALLALGKLGLGPVTSLLVVLGIFVGGTIHIPVRRIRHPVPPTAALPGLFGLNPWLRRTAMRQAETVIAVNVGGCLIPCGLVLYQCVRLWGFGAGPVGAAWVATGINTWICYLAARPVPNLGIAMPAFLPGVVAAISALVLAREFAAPVAFVAGVLGPLLGADLLHLRDVRTCAMGFASIGGAGTFDGIVISGFIAVLLA